MLASFLKKLLKESLVYLGKPNFLSKVFLRNLLASKMIHSVRDEYTKEKLLKIVIKNVLNTSYPSTWNLTESHCNKILKTKSDAVVFTLTDYSHGYSRLK